MTHEIQLPPHKDCFVCGTPDDARIDIRYFWRDETHDIRAEVTFGPRAQGPPLHAHGGAIAAVLDEAMGTCAWMNGHMVVAVNIDVDYRRMVPLGYPLDLRCAVTRVEGRKVFAHGDLRTHDGEIVAESEGIFVVVGAEKMQGLVPGVLEDIGAFERYQRMREAQVRRAARED